MFNIFNCFRYNENKLNESIKYRRMRRLAYYHLYKKKI